MVENGLELRRAPAVDVRLAAQVQRVHLNRAHVAAAGGGATATAGAPNVASRVQNKNEVEEAPRESPLPRN